MINVAHDRDNRRPGFGRAFLTRQRLLELLLNGLSAFQYNTMTQFFYDQRRGVLVEHLIDVSHHTQVHKLFDDFACFDRHLLCQVAYRDVLGDIDVVDDFFRWLLKGMLIWLALQLLPPSTATPGHTGLGRLQVFHGKVVPSLLAARTGYASAFQPSFPRPAPQLVACRGVRFFFRSGVESLGLFVLIFRSCLVSFLLGLPCFLFCSRFGDCLKL